MVVGEEKLITRRQLVLKHLSQFSLPQVRARQRPLKQNVTQFFFDWLKSKQWEQTPQRVGWQNYLKS